MHQFSPNRLLTSILFRRVNITKPEVLVSSSDPCQSPRGFLTVSDRGRLGNMMSQYATLYAFARKFNLKAVISKQMNASLRKVFPHLSIEAVKCEAKVYNWTVLEVEELTSKNLNIQELQRYKNALDFYKV